MSQTTSTNVTNAAQTATKNAWDQIKDTARNGWSQLSDDDFVRAQGSSEKLSKIISEKFGGDRSLIRVRLDGQDTPSNAPQTATKHSTDWEAARKQT